MANRGQDVPIANPIDPRYFKVQTKNPPLLQSGFYDDFSIMVGLMERYSNFSFTEVNLLNLERIHNQARAGKRSTTTTNHSIRDVDRRLGQATLIQIAKDYEAGSSTIQLTKRYKISKSSVLRILRDQRVTMRPGTRE